VAAARRITEPWGRMAPARATHPLARNSALLSLSVSQLIQFSEFKKVLYNNSAFSSVFSILLKTTNAKQKFGKFVYSIRLTIFNTKVNNEPSSISRMKN
jgi:hypothetical protein